VDTFYSYQKNYYKVLWINGLLE